MGLLCKYCNKEYKSYQSRSNHIHKVHYDTLPHFTPNLPHFTPNLPQNPPKIEEIKCNFCNKIFSRKDNLNRHFKICKYKEEIKKLNQDNVIELKKEIYELKNALFNIVKIHPKTLQKINKNLINNNTINNITNNTIINKTYVNFNDSINYKLLTEKEILNILNRQWKCLEESIKTVHFNEKYPEYNNILITNLKDNNAYIFDGIKFSVISKDEVIHELINSHIDEIELSKNKFKQKISENKLKNLNKFIELINNNDKKYFHETYNKTYVNYKIYKCDLIKQFIYNNSNPKLIEKIKNINLENKEINYDYSSSDSDN